jgi:hypothetical protein
LRDPASVSLLFLLAQILPDATANVMRLSNLTRAVRALSYLRHVRPCNFWETCFDMTHAVWKERFDHRLNIAFFVMFSW